MALVRYQIVNRHPEIIGYSFKPVHAGRTFFPEMNRSVAKSQLVFEALYVNPPLLAKFFYALVHLFPFLVRLDFFLLTVGRIYSKIELREQFRVYFSLGG